VLDFNNQPEREGLYGGVVYPDERVLKSSLFTFVNDDGVEYQNAYFEDEPVAATPDLGNVNVYYTSNKQKIFIKTIGSICYNNSGFGPAGRVKINKFKTSYYENSISIYLIPYEKDIIANKNMILVIEPRDITVNIIDTVR
jgi:hypothetical protein